MNLAIPNILSNLSIPLLSSVDTAMMGYMENSTYLGAIAIGSMIFNFIYWGFGFLRMGTTGLTAQALGNESGESPAYIFLRSGIMALITSIGILLLQIWIADISFYFTEAKEEIELLGRSYFDIRIWASPATLALYAFHGWFLGMQNARYPLYLALFVNVSNIIFNIIFVIVFDLKSDGVAYGTLISQYLGLILAAILMWKKYKSYFTNIDRAIMMKIEKLKEFFSVNGDIFIRTICLIFTFTFFTVQTTKFEPDVLAAYTIILQLWSVLAYGVDGFAFAAESLVGLYLGAKDKMNFRKSIRYSFIWGMAMAVGLSIIFYFFDYYILRIYTNQIPVIEIMLTFYIWTIFAPINNTICFIWDGIYIGATATAAMRNSMLISTIFVFLPTYYLTVDMLGNHALWLAMTTFMAARGLSLTWYSKKHIYELVE